MVIHPTIVVFREKWHENQSEKFMSIMLVLFTDIFKALEINKGDWIFVNFPKSKILQCENCSFFYRENYWPTTNIRHCSWSATPNPSASWNEVLTYLVLSSRKHNREASSSQGEELLSQPHVLYRLTHWYKSIWKAVFHFVKGWITALS